MAETVLLPDFFGARIPSLTAAILVAGVSWQGFRAGFWFSGLAGLMADIFSAPSIGLSHTAFTLGVFFAVSFFRAIVLLDEPLSRLVSAAVGFLSLPLAWLFGRGAGQFFFEVPVVSSGLAVSSFWAWRELIFALLFFAVLAFFSVRRFKQRRLGELSRI